MDPLGILFSLIAAVFWGSYLVPVKKVALNERPYVLLMGLSMFIVIGASLPFMGVGPISDPGRLLLGVLGGVFWSLGNLLSIHAVRAIGISRAVPIFILSVVVNAFYGIIMFHELEGGTVLVLGIGILLVLIGVTAAQMTGDRSNRTANRSIRSFGIAAALLTAFAFGTYNAPIRAMGSEPLTSAIGLLLGTAIVSTAIGLVKFEKGPFLGDVDVRTAGLACLSGILWAIGTTVSIFAIDRIGLARTFPITTLNVLIYILWGIIYYKEVPTSRLWLILVGASLLFAGVLLVAST